MRTIEEVIEEFRRKCLDVYRADPDRIIRDTRIAERAARDHVGRWLFELLQNSDDADAEKVRILVEDDVVYVADNGRGLKAEAVSAICGTDFSDKTTGTIGRKGVGFKSVYAVSSNPQVFTVNGEGVEFSPDKAGEWLRRNGFDDVHVPYQWIPFSISWRKALEQDPTLGTLGGYKTVVRLSGVSTDRREKVEQLLKEWPPHALFAFRNVRRIEAPHLKVVLTPGGDVWKLDDSRGEAVTSWLVARHTEHDVPPELLEPLGTDERKTIKGDGVSFLIAAPLANDCVMPTDEYLPIHVFYPTEQKGPVRLLLHGEFLVKSDRTALISIDESPFNTWVAKSLARQICRFVDGAFLLETPSSHVALLMPFEDRKSHAVAEALWQQISEVAKAHLRLADIDGDQRLAVDEARLLSVTIRPDLARKLLGATDVRGQLLHCSFDEDKDARKALKELGCGGISDQEVMKIIVEKAPSQSADAQWVWTCWEWLAAWVGKEPHGEKHKERVEKVMGLPVVPVAGHLLRPSDLVGRIVTWEPDERAEDLPDWLPLTFVDAWFRDHIQRITEQDSAVKKLLSELEIDEPGADVIQRAVARAIEQYWKDRHGDPLRFLNFIFEQDWHETSLASPKLQRCPVPLLWPSQENMFAEARKAYFGRGWGNDLLADLYDSIDAVVWVVDDGAEDSEGKRRRVLEWLGVADCPRVVKEAGETDVWRVPVDYSDWKRYLETERNRRGAVEIRINDITNIDHLVITGLKHKQAVLFIHLLASHWGSYYSKHHKSYANLYGPRGGYYGREEVKTKWWWEVCEKLTLPVRGGFVEHAPLKRCWLPDKKTRQDIGDLLPAVDLEAFESDKDIVHNWLVSAVGLRTRIDQVTVKEWKELLSTRIPAMTPSERAASDERLRDKVTGWYEACLETVKDQENVPEKAFAAFPLLCRKGNSWQYIYAGPRYLDDDNEFAKAFAGDAWLFHIPSRLTADAVKYFGVPTLSKSVEVHVERGEPQTPLDTESLAKFNDSLPYVWAWRSSKSKQGAERLSPRLKSLKVLVVPALKARLGLNGMAREVERRWDVSDDILFLHENHTNEAELSQALAEAVGFKSEADFYENLLRCDIGDQRKEKLLSKGMSEAEVERCLREYSERPEAEEEGKGEQTKQGVEVPPPLPPSAPGGERQRQEGGASVQLGGLPVQTKEPTPAGKSFCLKDAGKVDYVVGSQLETGADRIGGGGGGVTPDHEAHALPEKEKMEVEEAGRRVATRELKKLGYAVEQMPVENPGFDLRGRRGGEELRVEVKGHTGRATVADITKRQYKEYLGQQGYRWELWNVEHLAAQDVQQVVITRYYDIPDDALDARTFLVNLKKCRSLVNSS